MSDLALPFHLQEPPAHVHRTRTADRWFESLRKRVHTVVECGRKDRDVRVKIAILDTGIDLQHPLIKKHCERIKICKSFFDRAPEGDQDSCGHGTHAAGLLLEVAPNAELYVGRVFVTGKEKYGS